MKALKSFPSMEYYWKFQWWKLNKKQYNLQKHPTINPEEPGAFEKICQRNINERNHLLRDLNISKIKAGMCYNSIKCIFLIVLQENANQIKDYQFNRYQLWTQRIAEEKLQKEGCVLWMQNWIWSWVVDNMIPPSEFD